MLGTGVGLGGSSAILWYWWPEAHGYFTNPFAMFLLGTAMLADLIYPICMWRVRQTEVVLEGGRIVSREEGMRIRATGKRQL